MVRLLVRCVGGPLSLCASQAYRMIYSAVHSDNAMANADMAAYDASKQARSIYQKVYVTAKNVDHAVGDYREIHYITCTDLIDNRNNTLYAACVAHEVAYHVTPLSYSLCCCRYCM
jgi:hypothetical protein